MTVLNPSISSLSFLFGIFCIAFYCLSDIRFSFLIFFYSSFFHSSSSYISSSFCFANYSFSLLKAFSNSSYLLLIFFTRSFSSLNLLISLFSLSICSFVYSSTIYFFYSPVNSFRETPSLPTFPLSTYFTGFLLKYFWTTFELFCPLSSLSLKWTNSSSSSD